MVLIFLTNEKKKKSSVTVFNKNFSANIYNKSDV